MVFGPGRLPTSHRKSPPRSGKHAHGTTDTCTATVWVRGTAVGYRRGESEDRGVVVGTELQLVGRDPELRTLLRILPDTGLGLPRAAAVLGEPGIGKTHLLTKFASHARGRGFDVLTARGRPGTAIVPAGTLLDVLPAAPPVGDDGSVLWWVRNTLVGHSDKLVVLIDDAHLADPLSLAVCDHLANSGRVAVIVAARSTEPEPTGLTHFAASEGVHRVQLKPLDIGATSALVRQIEGGEVSDDSVREVHRLTSGVPLVVRELVRAAGDAGAGVTGAAWQWSHSIAGDPRLASLFSSRLSHVPDETIRVLWLLVAADGPIPESAAVTAISPSAVSDAVARGLLVLNDGWLGWSHPLLGELAVQSLTGNRTTATADRTHVGAPTIRPRRPGGVEPCGHP